MSVIQRFQAVRIDTFFEIFATFCSSFFLWFTSQLGDRFGGIASMLVGKKDLARRPRRNAKEDKILKNLRVPQRPPREPFSCVFKHT
jgi:hypothetical protein